MAALDDVEVVCTAPSTPRLHIRAIWLCSFLFLLLCLRDFALKWRHIHGVFFQDDAFYYLVIAKHIAQTGRSTFDGFTLTNGYHPLWTALLALQYKLVSESELLTRCIEYLLGLGSLITTLFLVRLPNVVLNLIFTIGFFWILAHISFNGMETALFAFCFGLFAYASRDSSNSSRNPGIGNGLLAAAAVAARIDAVVFMLPHLFLGSKSRRERISSFCVFVACGLLYMWFNYHYFKIAMPISGEVKSLGGLQLNHTFLTQMASRAQAESQLLYLTLALLLTSPLILLQKNNKVPPALVGSFAIGLLAFLLRLCFFSSWRIWPWYDYPLLIGYVACFPSALLWVFQKLTKFVSYRLISIATGLFLMVGLSVSLRGLLRGPGSQPLGNFAVNHKAIDEYGPTLNDAYVAMGDRAGNFAYQYPGGVSQLEGLMNDRQYFDVLKRQGNIKELLCQRHVRFLLSYEADLKTYQTYRLQTIRHDLSQFPAPMIEVEKQDEVGKVSDLAQFNSTINGDPKNFLYIWRLRCDLPETTLRHGGE